MKKKHLLNFILIICLAFVMGCSKIDSLIESNSENLSKDNTDTIIESSTTTDDVILNSEVSDSDCFWKENIVDDTAMIIVSNITDKEMNTLNNVENIILNKDGEEIVVVAAIDDVTMEIWSVEYADNNLVEKELVHKRTNMKKNEAINIKAVLPEGIPNYKIKGNCNKGNFEYDIASHDGKNGDTHLQYISYETSETNKLIEDKSIKSVKSRIFFYDSNDLKEYYVDKDIDVEGKAIVKSLTKEMQKASSYNSNFVSLNSGIDVTSAKIEEGVLKIEFFSNDLAKKLLDSSTEAGLIKAVINTYGYNLNVNKVAVYFNSELYTGEKEEAKDGYFNVDFSEAGEYNEVN